MFVKYRSCELILLGSLQAPTAPPGQVHPASSIDVIFPLAAAKTKGITQFLFWGHGVDGLVKDACDICVACVCDNFIDFCTANGFDGVPLAVAAHGTAQRRICGEVGRRSMCAMMALRLPMPFVSGVLRRLR